MTSAPDEIVAAKVALRHRMAESRAGVHAMRGREAAERLRDVGLPVLHSRTFETLSGFWPIRTEIDPRPLMRALLGPGKRLGLPVVIGPGPLEFRAWRPGEELAKGPLSTHQPLADAERVEPDLLLVPLLAFDRRRYRMGYGAGHYDATIARLRAMKPIFTAGIAFAVQEVDRVPTDSWDEPLDIVITEEGVI